MFVAIVLWFSARIIVEEGNPCNRNNPSSYLHRSIFTLFITLEKKRFLGEKLQKLIERRQRSILCFWNRVLAIASELPYSLKGRDRFLVVIRWLDCEKGRSWWPTIAVRMDSVKMEDHQEIES